MILDKKTVVYQNVDLDLAVKALKYFMENYKEKSDLIIQEMKNIRVKERGYLEINPDFDPSSIQLSPPENEQAGINIKIDNVVLLVYQSTFQYTVRYGNLLGTFETLTK